MVPGGPRQARDVALRRLLRTKRWILAVSVALVGALAGLAANAFPGKTIKSPAAGEGGASGSSSPAGSSTEGSSSSLTSPEQAPRNSEQGEAGSSSGEQGASSAGTEAPVVSGGS